jgi:FkbM family methyltransferase
VFTLDAIIGSLPRSLEVLDIGARLEEPPRYSPLVARDMANVTAVEPQAADRERLTQSFGAARMRCLPHVLGDGRLSTLHVTRHPGCTSLFAPDPRVVDLFQSIGAADPGGNFHVVATERVPTVALDDVSPPIDPDFIKLDIQGAELPVLRHGRSTLSRATVVETEVLFVPLYRDQPLAGEVMTFMTQEGFWLHRILDVHGRCYRPLTAGSPTTPVSQPLWCDMVFVRDPSRLERWSDPDLLRGATLLHDLYHSYDLVNLLLAEHDRRMGSAHAIRYREALQREGSVPVAFITFGHGAR